MPFSDCKPNVCRLSNDNFSNKIQSIVATLFVTLTKTSLLVDFEMNLFGNNPRVIL